MNRHHYSYRPCAVAYRAGTRTRRWLTPSTSAPTEPDLSPLVAAMWRPLDYGPPSARFLWHHARHIAAALRPTRNGWLTRACQLVPWWSFIIIGPLALIRWWPTVRHTLWTITTLTVLFPLAITTTTAATAASWTLRYIAGPPLVFILAIAGFTGPGVTDPPTQTAGRMNQLQRHIARTHRHQPTPHRVAQHQPRPEMTLAERQVLAAEQIVALETRRQTQPITAGRRRFTSDQLLGLAIIGTIPIALVLFLAIAGAIVSITEPKPASTPPDPAIVIAELGQ